jgi:site-specific recombinase XerC
MRPKVESGEGKTPAIGNHQARKLLAAPPDDTIKNKRDRAILSTLLFHALRREELCKLKVKDFRHARKGVPHLKGSGKGGRRDICRCIPAPTGLSTITSTLQVTPVTTTGRCSARSATTAVARPNARSRRTAFAS